MANKIGELPLRTYHLCILLCLAIILAYASGTIFSRHFQVDELSNTYSSRLLVHEEGRHFVDGCEFYMIPLGYLISLFDSSELMIKAARFVFFLFFLANLTLIAYGQPYFTSRIGRLLVLIGASLCHLHWTYGFEIRHDVLLLTGNLLLFTLTQQSLKNRISPAECLIGGIVFTWTLLAAQKAMVFAIPFTFLLLLSQYPKNWWRFPLHEFKVNILCFILGASCLFLLIIIAVQSSGNMTRFFETYKFFAPSLPSVYSSHVSFSLIKDLIYVASTSPLTLSFSFCFIIISAWDLLKEPSLQLTPSRITLFYFFWCWAIFLINPQPYPYNLLNLVPFTYIAALDIISRIQFKNIFSQGIFVSLILCTMLICFAARLSSNTYTYIVQSNIYQLAYMRAAEDLTDPQRDTVLDGIGLVSSRMPPDKDWFLHSNNMSLYRQGKRSSFSEIIENNYPPVVITNYRWSWLSKKDIQTLADNYIPLANNFWVLGRKVKEKNGFFDIQRSGRYITRLHLTDQQTGDLLIDNHPLDGVKILNFKKGRHSFANVPPEGIVIHWLGPKLDTPPIFPYEPKGNNIVLGFF